MYYKKIIPKESQIQIIKEYLSRIILSPRKEKKTVNKL